MEDHVASHSGCQRYVGVVFDKMKIKGVFNKHIGDIIGFTDLGDPEPTFSLFENHQPVARTAIAFLVRGLIRSLKVVLCYFFTSGFATSFQIFHLFWQVVSVLELNVNLWVVGATQAVVPQQENFF